MIPWGHIFLQQWHRPSGQDKTKMFRCTANKLLHLIHPQAQVELKVNVTENYIPARVVLMYR